MKSEGDPGIIGRDCLEIVGNICPLLSLDLLIRGRPILLKQLNRIYTLMKIPTLVHNYQTELRNVFAVNKYIFKFMFIHNL